MAVKSFKPEVVQDELIERFVREGEALRQLNHPNIVKMLEMVEDGGQHHLVMEYVSGGSLRDLLDETPQPPLEQVLNIALDLSDALIRAHRLDIIHRDLKPANVLLANDGTLRLSDFGVAHLGRAERVTGTGVLVGTVDYMAPEVLNGAEADARSDIWAFGVLLYEMLTGERPFKGQTLPEVLLAITANPILDLAQVRPDLPADLVTLVQGMLVKDPDRRIQSVRQVGAILEDLFFDRHSRLPHLTPSPVLYSYPLNISDPAINAQAIFNEMPLNDLPERAILPPYSRMPHSPNPLFVGREAELKKLAELLKEDGAAEIGQVVAATGLGGIGKSNLAMEFAHRYGQYFLGGVYWLNCG